jgi:hypothetical protein
MEKTEDGQQYQAASSEGEGSSSPKSPSSTESAHSGELSSVISPHYDASRDVVIRMEYLGERQMKVQQALVASMLSQPSLPLMQPSPSLHTLDC